MGGKAPLMKPRIWRPIATILAAVLVAVLAVQATRLLGSARAQAPQFVTATVGRGTVDETVSATGTVQAPVTDSITFSVSGTVTDVPVQVGSKVKAGQVLARLDSRNLQAQMVTAQGQLAQAQANLQKVEEGTPASQLQVYETDVAQARANMDAKLQLDQEALIHAQEALKVQQDVYAAALRAYDLQTPTTPSLVSLAQEQQALAQQKAALQSDQQAVQTARAQLAADRKTGEEAYRVAVAQLRQAEAPPQPADVAQAQAAVTQAQGQVALVQSQIAEMTITSPVDGVVVADDIEPGENVSVGQVAFQVQQAGALQGVVPVDEIDIAKIKLGQRTQTSLDALPGQTFPGKVMLIAPTGTASNGVSTYNVTVSLPDDPRLQAGMSATVDFLVAEKRNVLRVPAEAVQGAGRFGTVQVLVGGVPRPRRVGLGLTSDRWTEVTSGLRQGDVVVVARAQTQSGFGGGPPGRFIRIQGGPGGR
jgi:HlyD family secretion protein